MGATQPPRLRPTKPTRPALRVAYRLIHPLERLSARLATISVGLDADTARLFHTDATVSNGVEVDEHLRAGADVWAIGDIANYQSVVHGRRLRIEHWDVALNQGAYVGRTWAGTQDGPYDVVPYFFSDIGDWTWFEYVGPGTGRVDVRGSLDSDDFVAYYLDDADQVVACLGVNRSDDVEAAKALITDHRSAPAA